jgi:hypothetical protein
LQHQEEAKLTAYFALRLTARANRHLALGATLHDRIPDRRARCVILWTGFAVMPAEIVFDAIEAELERRGVAL